MNHLSSYIQYDNFLIVVDLFFMKTCSFRGAQPRYSDNGIFCGSDEPEARYTMTPCQDEECDCCYPYDEYKPKKAWPVVDFDSSSKHRFLNGYTSYLNCPAVS